MHNKQNEGTYLFQKILDNGVPFGISVLTYQEILQGARNESDEKKLRSYLSTQKIYHLPSDLEFYNKAAMYRRKLRQSGVTIRSTIDLLIATTAIHFGLSLLHSDKDFKLFADKIETLKEYF